MLLSPNVFWEHSVFAAREKGDFCRTVCWATAEQAVGCSGRGVWAANVRRKLRRDNKFSKKMGFLFIFRWLIGGKGVTKRRWRAVRYVIAEFAFWRGGRSEEVAA